MDAKSPIPVPNSTYLQDLNVTADEGIEAFKNLERNNEKIKVPEMVFSKEHIKLLSDEANRFENCLGVKAHISLNDQNEISVYLEVIYESETVGPVPGPGVGRTP